MRADPCPQFNWKEVIIDVCRLKTAGILSEGGMERPV